MMQKIVMEYDYYTLEQAREIIRNENRQKYIKKNKRIAKRRMAICKRIARIFTGILLVVSGFALMCVGTLELVNTLASVLAGTLICALIIGNIGFGLCLVFKD